MRATCANAGGQCRLYIRSSPTYSPHPTPHLLSRVTCRLFIVARCLLCPTWLRVVGLSCCGSPSIISIPPNNETCLACHRGNAAVYRHIRTGAPPCGAAFKATAPALVDQGRFNEGKLQRPIGLGAIYRSCGEPKGLGIVAMLYINMFHIIGKMP